MSDTPPTAAPASSVSIWQWWPFRLARIVVIPYIVVVLLLMGFEERLIFPAFQSPHDNWQPQGLPIEEVSFKSLDGVALHGWYVPHATPVAVILFAHGNSGNITHRTHALRKLHAAGASVFIFDYRGYGRSEGSPNEAGVLMDARAARAWLAERAQVKESEIVLLGESLGGGVAVDLAAGEGARGLILESTFTSLPDVAARSMPWIPVHWLMRNRLDSRAKIGKYHGPLLQSHGDRDEVIPYALGEQLFAAANEPKTFLTLPGASHNARDSAMYDELLARWLKELPRAPAQ